MRWFPGGVPRGFLKVHWSQAKRSTPKPNIRDRVPVGVAEEPRNFRSPFKSLWVRELMRISYSCGTGAVQKAVFHVVIKSSQPWPAYAAVCLRFPGEVMTSYIKLDFEAAAERRRGIKLIKHSSDLRCCT